MRSVLGPVDIAGSTMANIAPAMSFFFGFGFLALTAGIASPLTIIAAGVAIAFLANTLAQFSRAHPSTGSFITFIGKAFGPTSAIATAVILITGYVIAITSVLVMSGGFTAIFLNRYLPALPTSSWPWFMVVFISLAAFLMVRGIHISTRWAGVFFAFEIIVLVVVTISALVHHAGHLTLHPFEPRYLSNGFKGLGLGFPLAVYLFIGWENSATLAEETENPRRNVPRALFASVALMMVSYVLFAYATVEGFGENVAALTASPIPFITVADNVLGVLAFFAYLAGVTSTLACLIAAVNSQSRLLFNAGREGLLPAWLGRVYARRQTPVNALLTFIGIGFVLVFAWSVGRHLDPVTLFAEASTLGTILVLVVYFVANLALPVFYRKHYPDQLSPLKHVVIPIVGAALIALPIYELVKPGQEPPYDRFPLIALAVIVVAGAYAVLLNSRDKTLADRVGSLVADDPADGKFARFFDEEEDPLHRLQRVTACLNQDRDVKAVVQEALPIVADALGAASAAVFVIKPGGASEALAVCGETRRGFPYPSLDLGDPLLRRMARRPRILETSDCARLQPGLLAVLSPETARLVAAPQAAGAELDALLVIGRRSPEPLSAREAQFLEIVSETMGLAIRSRLLATESRHAAAVLQTAYAVSRAITQSLDLELTYREIAANAARVARGSHCLLFELERGSGDYLAVASSDPESEDLLGTRVRLDGAQDPGAGGAGEFVVRRVVAEPPDARSVSKFGLGGARDARLAGLFNAESSLLVPLFAQQELVGSLLVYAAGRRRRFSALEVAELGSVGEQAAIAIHNAQLYRNLAESQASIERLLARLTRIRDQERQALARVVHDDIVQSIVGAIYRFDDVRDAVTGDQAGAFDQAVAGLRRTVDDARRVIWELRPPAIDGLGLPAALRSLADRAGEDQAAVDVSIEGDADLSDAVTTGLYKIAREALMNALHHADARRIGISLVPATRGEHRSACLLIEDDGIGFAVDDRPEGGHYGTVMMEEQATLIGAALTIDSRPGRGTRVEVVVPLVPSEVVAT
ncbi:MAG TPA: amino acid permease [Thermoleophilia bacterium]|nr:amino acid permease [Thermoleophilia bacterium]